MMDEIRCKKCGLWLERPDSICPRCIAIDGSEEEKRKFYENMDEHSIENAHISSIKKVAETLLRDGQHYTIDPREIINLINMLEYARATRIPPDSGAIRELGTRLVDLLDEDDWNNLEPFLLKAKGAQIELEAEITRLTAEVERYRAVLEGAEYRNIDNLKNESVEKCRAIGAMAALLTVQLRTRAEQAEAALRELYTYPGVRDLLAPTDSLGSIARRVEHVLK